MIQAIAPALPARITTANERGEHLRQDQGQAVSTATDERRRPANESASSVSLVEQRQLQKLKNTDRAVRAHEMAHQTAGGRHITHGAQYSYVRGPDGRQYAVAGEVGIDTSPVAGDPRATLDKAQAVRRAALAPLNPSATDRRVAAQAAVMMQQARLELALQAEQENSGRGLQIDTFA